MFITAKRHEREKQELAAGNRLTEAILKNSAQGFFLLDGKGKVLPQGSRSLASLFRRQDFAGLSFEKLLAPIITAKTLTVVRTHIAGLLAGTPPEPGTAQNPLNDLDVRLTDADGSLHTAHYSFEFHAIEGPPEARGWLVCVTDITAHAQATRELEDLRAQVQTQGEILRGVLQMGGARFGTFLQRADASMKIINAVLKKPAREEDAFRHKLEETLEEVDRIRREAAAFRLSALEASARRFEDALHDLRKRASLSGSDFLPLAVKLDQLFGQLTLVRSLTVSAAPVRERGAAPPGPPVTDSGTQIIEAPKFAAEVPAKPAPGTQRPAPAGSLDGALKAMTELVAHDQNKTVVLECHGLSLVPPKYQAAVKNVAVQLIRNAVMHGIESAAVREAAGKASHGTLRLEFKSQDDRFELMFEDDGCGLDPDRVRATAIERGVVSGEAAARMRDREAIKLIFKSGFTTLAASSTDKTHGAGMSLVRRYVHEAGGKVALASLPGHETRFKITFPAVPADDAAAAADARVA